MNRDDLAATFAAKAIATTKPSTEAAALPPKHERWSSKAAALSSFSRLQDKVRRKREGMIMNPMSSPFRSRGSLRSGDEEGRQNLQQQLNQPPNQQHQQQQQQQHLQQPSLQQQQQYILQQQVFSSMAATEREQMLLRQGSATAALQNVARQQQQLLQYPTLSSTSYLSQFPLLPSQQHQSQSTEDSFATLLLQQQQQQEQHSRHSAMGVPDGIPAAAGSLHAAALAHLRSSPAMGPGFPTLQQLERLLGTNSTMAAASSSSGATGRPATAGFAPWLSSSTTLGSGQPLAAARLAEGTASLGGSSGSEEAMSLDRILAESAALRQRSSMDDVLRWNQMKELEQLRLRHSLLGGNVAAGGTGASAHTTSGEAAMFFDAPPREQQQYRFLQAQQQQQLQYRQDLLIPSRFLQPNQIASQPFHPLRVANPGGIAPSSTGAIETNVADPFSPKRKSAVATEEEVLKAGSTMGKRQKSTQSDRQSLSSNFNYSFPMPPLKKRTIKATTGTSKSNVATTAALDAAASTGMTGISAEFVSYRKVWEQLAEKSHRSVPRQAEWFRRRIHEGRIPIKDTRSRSVVMASRWRRSSSSTTSGVRV